MATEKSKLPAVVLSTAQLNALCRADFVRYIKAENEHRDPALRPSLLAHRKGKQHGFDHPGMQLKWLDYKAGWLVGRASSA